jgi:ferrous iron transport protein B
MGMVLAAVSGIVLKKALFAKNPAAFVMELPPYRLPSPKNMALHVWERVRDFLVRAGTIIFTMSVILWFLESFNTSFQMVDNSADSILAVAGGALVPILRPLGFGVWQAAVAILTGLIAKEALVASLSMFYGFSLLADSGTIAAAMTGFTPLSAFSFLVFILLYVPCIAAVSTIFREMNSLKWTAFSVTWQIGAAYTIAFIVYQIGTLLGL